MDSKNVLAVIVGYNGGEKILNTISRLCIVVENILVVDNGSTDGSNEKISTLNLPNVKLIKLGQNTGIGRALNVGVRYAETNGFKWLLTMDQDTLVDADLLVEYSKAYERNQHINSYAPSIVVNSIHKRANADHYVEYAITSGHMVSVGLIFEVGCYSEDLFIDGVDFDFCLKLKRFGHKTMCVPTAIIHHELGAPHSKRGWLSKFYSDHSPIRRYYIYRNFFYLLRNYFGNFPLFIAKLFVSQCLMLISILFYERKASISLRYIAKGVYHGIIGRFGRVEVKNM